MILSINKEQIKVSMELYQIFLALELVILLRIIPTYDGSTVESGDQTTLDSLLTYDWTATVDSVNKNTMYITSAYYFNC